MDAGSAAAQHQGFPVLDSNRRVMGVVTRRNLLDMQISGESSIGSLVRRPPLVVSETHSAREAADHMVAADVGRLIVVADDESSRMVGIVTRGDLLSVHTQRLRESHHVSRDLSSVFKKRA
jgi:CBS domain-containing protein